MSYTPHIPMTLHQVEQLYPIGKAVRYYPLLGFAESVRTSIRSRPWTTGDGAVVIKIECRAGGVSLFHISPLQWEGVE